MLSLSGVSPAASAAVLAHCRAKSAAVFKAFGIDRFVHNINSHLFACQRNEDLIDMARTRQATEASLIADSEPSVSFVPENLTELSMTHSQVRCPL